MESVFILIWSLYVVVTMDTRDNIVIQVMHLVGSFCVLLKISNRFANKEIQQNTTLSEQFQSPIEISQKEEKSVPSAQMQ
jgi:hypothetical protein